MKQKYYYNVKVNNQYRSVFTPRKQTKSLNIASEINWSKAASKKDRISKIPLLIKRPNCPKWLRIHEYSSESDLKVIIWPE